MEAERKSTSSPHGDVLIQVQEVRKIYHLGKTEVQALKGLTFEIYEGEYLSIMGPSGSGKSTLFNMIGALDRPTSGTVIIGGVDLSKVPSRKLAYIRCNYIGYIFQAYNLIPSLTARENVALPLTFRGISKIDAAKRADEVLSEVGLGHRLTHRPDELSGGQQQRVAIARALANEPSILLADEPTGNLDLKTGQEIIDILKHLSTDRGVTVITATHDHKMLSASDRIMWIEDGAIERLERRENIEIRVGKVGGEEIV
ncbi:MAG: ABC transporter ATP-binding protein [Kiritimatiellaeota bacterium]|nr:ABC transporter ATP-binding protein [Kiritimatiellota bacterium]